MSQLTGQLPADHPRILVVKLADLGDLLTATPALRALRMGYPTAEITALVTPHTASLLRDNDAVDHLITFPKAVFDAAAGLARPRAAWRAARLVARLGRELHHRQFDAVVLLHHLTTGWGRAKYRALLSACGTPIRAGLDNGHGGFLTHRVEDQGFGAFHEVDYWLLVVSTLGADHPDPHLEVHLRPEELSAASERWQSLELGDDAVVLHPGSGRFSLARRWPPSRFAAVGDAFVQDGCQVAVLAGPGEEELAREVQSGMREPSTLLCELGSPRELGATLHCARLFVGNDSGVMHMAAAVGVPVVGVFGLTNHRAWGPYPPSVHRVVRLDLPCSPCLYTGYQLGSIEGCPPRTCLETLEPAAVVAAARELLGRTERSADVN